MSQERFLRGFTLVADDTVSTSLVIDTMKLPVMEEKHFDFTPGGSSGEIEVPLGVTNKLRLPFTLADDNYDIQRLFNLPPGQRTSWTASKMLVDENDPSGRAIEKSIDVLGRLMKIDPKEMSGGEKAGYDYEIGAVRFYREVDDGKVLWEFNHRLGGWTIRDGVEVNKDRRRILRLGG